MKTQYRMLSKLLKWQDAHTIKVGKKPHIMIIVNVFIMDNKQAPKLLIVPLLVLLIIIFHFFGKLPI